jgi:hypothetical protein
MRRIPMTETTSLRERLAALEHEQWAHWTRYFLDNLTPENIERWRRQLETPYERLSEPEKQRDREWADRVLMIFEASAGSKGRGTVGKPLREEEV